MAMAAISEQPTTRRFTSDEVWRMVDTGILGPDEPYELIDGELLYVSPANPPHAGVIGRLNTALVLAYAPRGYIVRVQCPIGGIADSIPEPDLAVVPIPAAEQGEHPRADQAALIVEVSDTTLRGDIRKRPIYAAAGAPVYWIVDLGRDAVVVHTGPRSDGTWTDQRVVDIDGQLELARPRAGARRIRSAATGPRLSGTDRAARLMR